ncbi:MAG: hypothetical protein E6I65_05485 [Chloroflexi bacterium]|nr:MAG: hypothetical protein E6I65_05485 [Chloroflexota bacterium]
MTTERQRMAAAVGSGLAGGLDVSVLGDVGAAVALGDGLGSIEASDGTAMLCCGAREGGDKSEQPASSAAHHASAIRLAALRCDQGAGVGISWYPVAWSVPS